MNKQTTYIPDKKTLLELGFMHVFGYWVKGRIEYDNGVFYEGNDRKNVNSEQELRLLISLSESN